MTVEPTSARFRARRSFAGPIGEWRVADGALQWSAPSSQDAQPYRIPLGQIREMRLYRHVPSRADPDCVAFELRTETETVSLQSSAWLGGLRGLPRDAAAYRSFVRELAPAIAAANPTCDFWVGRPPARHVLTLLVQLGVVGIGSAGLLTFVGAPLSQAWPIGVAAAALLLMAEWRTFLLSVPGEFDPHALPDALMPKD